MLWLRLKETVDAGAPIRNQEPTTLVFLHSRPYLAAIQASLTSLQYAARSGAVEAGFVRVLVTVDRVYPELEALASAVAPLRIDIMRLDLLSRWRVRLTQSLAARPWLGPVARWACGSLRWQTTYWPKIRRATQVAQDANCSVMIKCDEDMVLSPTAWRVLIHDSDQLLSQPGTLLVTPALSSGIPSWLDFAKSLLDERDFKELLHRLGEFPLPQKIWSIDYGDVSRAQSKSMWDEDAHLSAMKNLHSEFRGYHPIRFDSATCVWLVERSLMKLSDFLSPVDADSVVFRRSNDYICNGVFAIRPHLYGQILDNNFLFLDPFDEVPLNILLRSGVWEFVIACNALGLHFLYNAAYSTHVDFQGDTLQGLHLEEALTKAVLLALRETN